jgi:hypothetical protein
MFVEDEGSAAFGVFFVMAAPDPKISATRELIV